MSCRCPEPGWFVGDPTPLARNNIFSKRCTLGFLENVYFCYAQIHSNRYNGTLIPTISLISQSMFTKNPGKQRFAALFKPSFACHAGKSLSFQVFLAHLCLCTVGSYASLSVCLMSLDQNPRIENNSYFD